MYPITFKSIFANWIIFFTLFVTALLWPVILAAHYNSSVGNAYYAIMYNIGFSLAINKGEQRIRRQLFASLEEEQSRAKSRGSNLKILEIGPGTGGGFLYYPKGSVVTTLELNAHLQKQQDQVAKKYPNLTIDKMLTGNIEDVKNIIDDNSFDVVIATHVLCCVKDKEKGLREVHRILKPGGKFFIYEFVYYDKKEHPILRAIQDVYRYVHQFVGLGCRAGSMDYENLLNRCGFNTSGVKYDIESEMAIPYSLGLLGVAVKE